MMKKAMLFYLSIMSIVSVKVYSDAIGVFDSFSSIGECSKSKADYDDATGVYTVYHQGASKSVAEDSLSFLNTILQEPFVFSRPNFSE